MASSARAARARADALARAKDGLMDAASMEMRATLDAWWPEGTDITDEIVEEVCDLVEAYASDAASYAADYFLQATGQQSELTPADVYDREWTRKEIRSAEAESGGARSFVRDRLVDHVSRMINRASGDYVVRSARRPAKGGGGGVRFARVPGGGETCAFCLMLASRGFVYWSRETAGEFDHYHAHCRCVVVASGERHPALDGYDPDGLYDRYRQCREAVQGDARGTVDTTSILREMERRDPEWLRTGREPELAYEDGAEPLDKEMAVGMLLKSNGFAVKWLARSDDRKSPDLSIRGRKWDVKQPTGSDGTLGRQTIYHQFEEAMAQGARPIIDVSRLLAEGACTLDEVLEQVERYVNWHFKVPGGRAKAGEALVTDLDGLHRIRARDKR